MKDAKHQRLDKAIKYLIMEGIVSSQEDVANKMKANKVSISKAVSGSPKYLTDNFMKRFCETFDVISYDWLNSGEGEMLKSINQYSDEENTNQNHEVAVREIEPEKTNEFTDLVTAINKIAETFLNNSKAETIKAEAESKKADAESKKADAEIIKAEAALKNANANEINAIANQRNSRNMEELIRMLKKEREQQYRRSEFAY